LLINEWIARFRLLIDEFPVQYSRWVELNKWYDKAVGNSPENLLRHQPDKKRSPKVLFHLAMMVDNTFDSTELIGWLRYCVTRRYNRGIICKINTSFRSLGLNVQTVYSDLEDSSEDDDDDRKQKW
jgi:hypothetical protein